MLPYTCTERLYSKYECVMGVAILTTICVYDKSSAM